MNTNRYDRVAPDPENIQPVIILQQIRGPKSTLRCYFGTLNEHRPSHRK